MTSKRAMIADREKADHMAQEETSPADERSWLYNHIGRIAGVVLGLFVVIVVMFLAIAGYEPAITLIVVIVSGFLIIAVGGKMRGGR